MILENKNLIGSRGLYSIGGIGFYVEIIDCRQSYGRLDVQIKPDSGDGKTKWVSLDSIKLIESKSTEQWAQNWGEKVVKETQKHFN